MPSQTLGPRKLKSSCITYPFRGIANFASLVNLSKLSLSKNKLKEFDPIHIPSTVTYLDVSSNLISTLPDKFSHLGTLVYLNVAANSLRALPDSLSSLVALTSLNAMNNSISMLPASLRALSSLTHLDLSNNQLTSLPGHDDVDIHSKGSSRKSQVGYLFPHLVEMRVASNSITTLDALVLFGCKKSLRVMDLCQNLITDEILRGSILAAFPGLRNLDLSFNNLCEFPRGLLARMNSLERLSLDGNMIEQPGNVFAEIPASLQTLLLDMNGLTEKTLSALQENIRSGLRRRSKQNLTLTASTPIAHEIIPKLYLGSMKTAWSRPYLRRLGVTHILTVATGLAPKFPSVLVSFVVAHPLRLSATSM
jgi:Leucine-rich repeat (LRR) protein